MRHLITRCPQCGDFVRHTHHCRASAATHGPVPFNRKEFERIRDEARDQARRDALAQTMEQTEMEFDQ